MLKNFLKKIYKIPRKRDLWHPKIQMKESGEILKKKSPP